ncbi:N-acetylmuramoyl-L-alanine amidase AmiB [Candidatus Photodesmus katoptron Akat1]|uniref:N-acetylmuramoyl-L-alanine amidase n=1 Tax=Candidatus Photodesmus katoptron Akat1 TaxID=1236703 RepID=S3EIJ0_9GAMM|nr:N-acetylmuramoyl-L-alanine amidase AmiB [Candidatus Photodesmus katoptron Akat1]
MNTRQVQFFFIFFQISCFFSSSLVFSNTLEDLRVWTSPNETRVVMDFTDEADYSYFILNKPERLVVDFKKTTLNTTLPKNVINNSILTKIRKSTPPNKFTYRLVFELKHKASKLNLFRLSPTPGGQYGHRLVINLSHPKKQLKKVKSNNTIYLNQGISRSFNDIIIAIDAGHGGEDSGSIGPTGKYEKHITLKVSKKLAEKINTMPGIKAILTRSGDYFVNLNKRSEIARKNKANLLVSIHADAFYTPHPRGASVFILNNKRADTEISRWIEDHESHSELLGGTGQVLINKNVDKDVSKTLLDLQFNHSQKESYKLATKILKEIKKFSYLHQKHPVNASLAILKSPDIPSVLVEIGFLSNPIEEKLLSQNDYQNKLAESLARAIVQYLKENPVENSLFFNFPNIRKHKVQPGEFLGKIAQQYSVTINQLRLVNELQSDQLLIGQIIMIPSNSNNL